MLLALATLIVTLIGMLTPYLNHIFFSDVPESGKIELLQSAAIFLVTSIVSSLLFSSAKSLLTTRIKIKLHITVQFAVMMRVLSLPADFFKSYSSGDLALRVQYVDEICSVLVSTVLQTGLTTVPALLILLLILLVSLSSAVLQIKVSRKEMELATKESGMSFALISGVQKIKLSGAEKRAFARWGNLYSQQAELLYRPPLFLTLHPVMITAVSLFGALVIYYCKGSSHA